MYAETVADYIEVTELVSFLTRAYEELAVMEMQHVRSKVMQSRNFYQNVADVYQKVRTAYTNALDTNKTHINELKKGHVHITTLQKNGKHVAVLIIPNERLSGPLGSEVFDSYIEYVKKHQCECVIIGGVAKSFMDGFLAGNPQVVLPYIYIEAPAQNTVEALRPIMELIISYQEISLFHGLFRSLLTQIPQNTSIAESVHSETTGEKSTIQYLFEPGAGEILNFFEVQIFLYFLLQAFFESHLAKLGSRITAMESSNRNAMELRKKLLIEQRLIDRQIMNKKQLQRVSSLVLWENTI